MERLERVERLHRYVGRLAAGVALTGGTVLLLLVVLTCASIVGRSLTFAGAGPIPGDFELVEIGMAFAVFSFLPWCHHKDGHARVDLFLRLFGTTTRWVLDVLAKLLMLIVAALVAWRLCHGMLDKFSYSETTFILQLPIGWGYAASLPGACTFVLVAASCLFETVIAQRPGDRRPPAA